MSDVDSEPRKRACVTCARKKTKCDRNLPCASCVAVNIQCRYVHKQPEKKQRVFISTRYEESLASINRQIQGLSQTLQLLVERDVSSSRQRSSDDGFNSAATTVRATADLPFDKDDGGDNDQHDYDGESSLYSQSKRIADNLARELVSASGNVTNGQAAAVDVAQALIQNAPTAESSAVDKDSSQQISCAFSQYPELTGLGLPPMDAVLRLLAFARVSPQSYFVDIPHTDEKEFAEVCQKIFFPTRPFTLFAWINVNCGLFFLFRDLDKSQYDRLSLTRSQVSRAVALCSNNIDKGVRSIPLCVTPSLEAVDALICAAVASMEQAKGHLGWKLVSAAARMCVDLGYHRLPLGYGSAQRSHKRKLFWYVYSMDRSQAFSFGRSPTIQDHAVTTERPIYSEDFTSKWGCTFLKYIDLAKIQYDIYEQLLCARAQREALSIRVQKVHEFAAKLSQIRESLSLPPDQGDSTSAKTMYEAARSMDIGFSSMLTLLYRILPPDAPINAHGTVPDHSNPLQFHSLCVEAGRTTLRGLVYRWNAVLLEQDDDAAKLFLNWSFLFVPFVPYIAVLGNQIATGSRDDLLLLRKVVEIVEAAANASSTMDKMYKAYSQLLRVAELWTSTNDDPHRGQSTSAPSRNSRFGANGNQSIEESAAFDAEMETLTTGPHSTETWQDIDRAPQDWDMVFNEFDLGLGADSAQEVMPWFEQNMSGC